MNAFIFSSTSVVFLTNSATGYTFGAEKNKITSLITKGVYDTGYPMNFTGKTVNKTIKEGKKKQDVKFLENDCSCFKKFIGNRSSTWRFICVNVKCY